LQPAEPLTYLNLIGSGSSGTAYPPQAYDTSLQGLIVKSDKLYHVHPINDHNQISMHTTEQQTKPANSESSNQFGIE
jgi:hypothetical protein